MALIHISVILVAVTAVLYQLEVSFDPLVASGTVILMRNREDSFKYAANVPHYHKNQPKTRFYRFSAQYYLSQVDIDGIQC